VTGSVSPQRDILRDWTRTHHLLILSLIQRLLSHLFSLPPRSKKAKQCCQTPTSSTVSQATEARPRTPAAAAPAPVSSSAAAPVGTTPPQHASRRRETVRRPHPTPRTQSTLHKIERLARAQGQARAIGTHPMSTSMSYSEPSQRLSKSRIDHAPQQP